MFAYDKEIILNTFIIILLTFISQIAGIALIVVGALPLFKIADIQDAFPENNPAIFPIIVLALGIVIFSISFLGCCGAIRESQCMINMVRLQNKFHTK